MPEPMLVTVSQLNKKINLMFDNEPDFGNIRVRGEVSDFKGMHPSGHYFFKLKDKGSSVNAIIFSGNKKAANGLKNGTEIVAQGYVSSYVPYGTYSLHITSVKSAQIGALSEGFERLKKKLEAEHLFEQKRPLPNNPEHICVITSETGDVIQDLRTILSRRCPQVKVTLIPTLVQGDKAPASIVSAFRAASRLDCDVIVFGRGGGSSEELAAFNDEAVARAVYNSKVPTISAVGHGPDFALTDFVADERAATMSEAAEKVVPDNNVIRETLEEKKRSLYNALCGIIDKKATALQHIDTELKLKSPTARIERNERELSVLRESIDRSINTRIERYERALPVLQEGLVRNVHTLIERSESRYEKARTLVEALNPFNVLLRGYSITYKDGRIVRISKGVKPGDTLEIKLHDGTINATVTSVEE